MQALALLAELGPVADGQGPGAAGRAQLHLLAAIALSVTRSPIDGQAGPGAVMGAVAGAGVQGHVRAVAARAAASGAVAGDGAAAAAVEATTTEAIARVAAAMGAIAAALQDARVAIAAMPALADRWQYASDLARGLRELADQAALARADIVADSQAADRLSLAQLSEVLGVSKARASQLIATARKTARTAEASPPATPTT